MPLMGALYVGQSGMQGQQGALNTTAHNLSNMETKGFTRQQVLLGTSFYSTVGYAAVSNMQVGHGVNYEQVRTVRDTFLDKSYRKESGRASFYQVGGETMNEVQTLLGEFQGTSFNDTLKNLWNAISEVKKTPVDPTALGALVQRASEFIERAQAVYSGLIDYQNVLNMEVKDTVDTINKYGKLIYEYNEKISEAELGGEKANDYRDERERLLDELGSFANISVKEDATGRVSVKIEGVSFVSMDRVYEMGVTQDNGTGFYTPVWPSNNNNKVFNKNQEISTDLNTDIGKLKSLVLARGDKVANYADMQNKNYYNSEIAGSLVMNTQAELDQLVHNMVVTINDIICGESAGHITYPQGTDPLPYELFSRIATERYELNPVTGQYEYVQENDTLGAEDTSTMYTIMNLYINPDVKKQPTYLNFRTPDGAVDQSKADELTKAFESEDWILNPNQTKPNSFMGYYSDFIDEISNKGSINNRIYITQNKAMTSIDNARQQICGVSSDEELTNMIKFQNAYNASSRYFNVINEMLEHLLQKLG